MCAQRLWPAVQVISRGLISNRAELLQQGVKAYNVQTVNTNSGTHCGIQPSTPSYDWRSWSTVTTPHQRISRTPQGCFNKVIAQNIQSSNTILVKEFKDNENEHAHNVMRSLPAYSATTVILCNNLKSSPLIGCDNSNNKEYYARTNWSNVSPHIVAQSFIELSHSFQNSQGNLEDLEYSSLCFALSKCLAHITNNQLLAILNSLSLWPSTSTTTTPNFMSLWNALDVTCTNQIKNWSISQLLLVADHWYALKLSRISRYNTEMTMDLGKRISSMSPSQLVQYLFYANLCRQLAPFINIKELERHLVKSIKYISIDELGVIAMGLFKTQTFPKSPDLLEAILHKTHDNLHSVTEPCLGAILKLLRRSLSVTHWSKMYSLMDALLPYINHLNHMCLLQIALLGNDLLVFHPGVINNIAVRFANNINEIRLKDLERITFVLKLYNFIPPDCPNIFNLIANELRRDERKAEIIQYPRCFVSCVVYLVTMGYFPWDLISSALQPSILGRLLLSVNYVNIDREINELDWAVEIEGPDDYTGHRLPPVERYKLTEKYLGRLPYAGPGITHQERLSNEIKEKLTPMLGGFDFVSTTITLPHNQTPDIVFCTNYEGTPVPLPQQYLSQSKTSLKKPQLLEELQWNAIIIGGRNSFIRNTEILRGTVNMKRRQLRKLGYNVAVIPFMQFRKKSLLAKLKYLESILFQNTTYNTESRVYDAYAILQEKKA